MQACLQLLKRSVGTSFKRVKTTMPLVKQFSTVSSKIPSNTAKAPQKKRIFGCQKVRDDYEELIITMKKNLDIIAKSFMGKGHNYLLSSLNNLLNIGLKEHSIVEELVKEIKDSKAYLAVKEAAQLELFIGDVLTLSESAKYKGVAMKILDEISEKLSMLRYQQLQNIEKRISNINNSQIQNLLKKSSFAKNIEKYQRITSEELQETIFKLNGIKESSKNYKIVSFDPEKLRFVLRDDQHNQEITVQGVTNEQEEVSSVFKQLLKEKSAFTLLIAQDQPLPDFDKEESGNLHDMPYEEAVTKMYRNQRDVESLSGMVLRNFIVNSFNDESFVFDFNSGEFKHRKLNVPENLSTLYLDFIRNAQSSVALPCKIVLADMPVNEYINSLVVGKSLPRLQETMKLTNFITLMGKCSFAHNTVFHTGCAQCNPQYSAHSRHLKKAPDAYMEVLTGDEEFLPMDQKIQYFSDKTYQTLLDNKEHKKVLVACGSFQLFDTVRKIMENDDADRDFDAYDFSKFKDQLRTEFGKKNHEYLEKIALLEVLHEVIDNGCVRELVVKGKNSIDFDKYISLIDHYTNILSFESISPNVKFTSDANSGKQQPARDCLADQLIFGLGENSEYVQEENAKESFFTVKNAEGKEEQVLVEDTPEEQRKKNEMKQQELMEEMKRFEEMSKPKHHIDQVYDIDQLKLLEKIVEVINQKTLFLAKQSPQIGQKSQRGKEESQNEIQPHEESSPPKLSFKKIKFKKHSQPRSKEDQDEE